MKIMKKVAILLAAIMVLTMSVFAAEASLTVDFNENGTPIPGAQFVGYKVGDVNDKGFVTLDESLGLDVDLAELTESEWQDLTLDIYNTLLTDQTEPSVSGTTGEDGKIVWEDFETGVYVLVGTPIKIGDKTFTPRLALIQVPVCNDDWSVDYNPVVKPKFEVVEDAKISYNVIKIWEDEENPEKRPQSINVSLYKDGAVFNTVVLNAENNWQHEWAGLSPNAVYSVTEEVPEGYTSSITQVGNTFKITNTVIPEPPAPTEPELPDTGMLQWPVPILAVSGMALVAIGLIRRRKGADEG